jgi:hypothetical protein
MGTRMAPVYTIESFFQVNKSKVKNFILSKELLLDLSCDEDRICGTSTLHETILEKDDEQTWKL